LQFSHKEVVFVSLDEFILLSECWCRLLFSGKLYDTITVAAHNKEVFGPVKSEKKMSQSILPGRQNVASGCPN